MICSPVISTESKMGEIQNKAKENGYHELIENSPFAIAMIVRRRFSYANILFSQIVGYDIHHLRQFTLRDIKKLIYKKDRETVWGLIREALHRNKQTVNLTTRIISKNKAIRWLDFTMSLAKDSKNTIIQITAVDVTKKREIEEQSMHAQKMEIMEQLTAGVAHQLSTPLAVISSRLQILEDDLAKEGQPGYLSHVKKAMESSQHMSTIITRLITFLRQTHHTKQITDVNQLIGEISAFLNDSAARKKIKIENVLSRKLPVIPAFRNKLEQAFLNIIVNAFDAMPGGGHIIIRTRFFNRNSPYLKIYFTDSGIGMTKIVKDKIFEPFFTTKPPSTGSGLGLFKAFCFVKEHNGKITVWSKKGVGTKITIKLPIIS